MVLCRVVEHGGEVGVVEVGRELITVPAVGGRDEPVELSNDGARVVAGGAVPELGGRRRVEDDRRALVPGILAQGVGGIVVEQYLVPGVVEVLCDCA